jgi:DNA-binding NarL/FixJ family response regulator
LFLNFQLDTLFYKGAGKVSSIDPYRIMLADDHAILRRDLKKILAARNDLEVIGEAADGLELLDLLRMSELAPHMVIVDITMPNLNGIEATRRIKMTHPDVKVLILTMHKSQEYLDNALSAGADGYLLKENVNTELFSAIEIIARGAVYVSPLLSKI